MTRTDDLSDPLYDNGEALKRAQPRVYDAATVIKRLEHAGQTMFMLKDAKLYPSGLKAAWPEIPAAFKEYAAKNQIQQRATNHDITLMDQAYGWMRFLPPENELGRRLVLLRSMVDPRNGKFLHPWRKLERLFGVDIHTVQNRHAAAIDIMVPGINAGMPSF